MKVLLHTCCAPCLIYPLETLRKEGFEVEAYFYNPNIHPEEEFIRRKEAFLDFAAAQGVLTHIPEYNPSDYTNAIQDTQSRCNNCWELRLKKTAEFAIVNNFAYFTTALLVSPYQDIEEIKRIGERMSVKFLFRDFRPGFREAHNRARAMGIYCQKYCGCNYSLEEREASGLGHRKPNHGLLARKKCRT